MIDLHLHLDGSIEPVELIKLAEYSDVKLPTIDEYKLRKLLSVDDDCLSLTDYLCKFDLPLEVLQCEKTIEKSVYFLVKRLSEQGLCYAEIRFAPQLHTQRGMTQDTVVKSAIKGLNDAISDFNMPSQLILCCMRMQNNADENIQTIETAKKYLNKGVCAVDLAGDEARYSTDKFTDIFKLAKGYDIPVIIHAGEADGANSVKQALDMGAKRIGHGVHSIEDESVMAYLKDSQIPLEICYTSNLQTKAIENHPINQFIDRGLNVTINTDNMTVSNTTLKNEYIILKKKFDFTNAQLKQLALNSAKSAFVSENLKNKLIANIEADFDNWIS